MPKPHSLPHSAKGETMISVYKPGTAIIHTAQSRFPALRFLQPKRIKEDNNL